MAVIIPALNESENLDFLLPLLRPLSVGQTLVCDNGSTDDTAAVTLRHGAEHVREPRRGYGAACFAGMRRLAPSRRIVVFVDADQGETATLLDRLVVPIQDGEADFVIGARVDDLREEGAATLPQRLCNRLMPALIRAGWGHRFTDLGPFRAVRRSALDAMNMQDRAYGWTIEMQIRAVELGLRIREVAIPHRKRRYGRNRISGTVRGVLLAAYWIVRTCGVMWVTRRRRQTRSDALGHRDHNGRAL
ncbi:MAG: glycosyltransferase family 2 protein [Phycisphaerae bacterium]